MICVKCKKEVPDGAFCLMCGARQQAAEKKPYHRQRANGLGTAYKRGRTWTASICVGWKKDKDRDKLLPIKKTKGGFTTKRDALEYCQKLKTGGVEKAAPTIENLYNTFAKTKMKKLAESRQTALEIAYNRVEGIKYTEITSLGIENLQDLIKGLTYYPARDIKALMSHLYKISCAQQETMQNLALYMQLPELEESETMPFTNEEVDKLWRGFDSGIHWAGYILLMIYSGMMPGELQKCEKSMIDLEHHTITGCGLKTNIRKQKPIVLADFVTPVVQCLMDATEGKKLLPINKDNFYKRYYETLKACGCRELKPYSCRHTTGTALAMGKNVSPSAVQSVMRHAKFSTTQRYIHPDIEDSLNAINKINPANEKGT